MVEQLQFGPDDEEPLKDLRRRCARESIQSGCPMFIIRFEVIVGNKIMPDGEADFDKVLMGSDRPLDSDEFRNFLRTLLEPEVPVV